MINEIMGNLDGFGNHMSEQATTATAMTSGSNANMDTVNQTSPNTSQEEHGIGRMLTAIGSFLERFGTFFVLVVTSLLAGASVFTTWLPSVSTDQSDESLTAVPIASSPISYIVTFLIAAALIVACVSWCRQDERGDAKKWMPIAAVIAMVTVTTALQAWWVSVQQIDGTNYYDAHMLQLLGHYLADGQISQLMSSSLDGPFKELLKGTKYLMCYPYQSGMVMLWYELYKWFGNDAVSRFLLLNVIMNEITLVSLYVIGTATVKTNRGRVLLAALLGAFVPHLVYSGFVYGNQIGLGCALAAAAIFSIAMRQNKAWKTVLISIPAVIPAILMYWAKSTFIIILIAIGIVWLISVLRRRDAVSVAGMIAFIAVLAVAGGMKSAPKQAIERKVGYELGEGIPMTSWFEIGLGDDSIMSSDMPGWWFPVAQDNFIKSKGNQEEIKQRVSDGISAELNRMADDPAYTAWFFTTKVGSEWLNPDFESRFFGGQVNYTMTDDNGTPYDDSDDEVRFFQRIARRHVNYDKAKEIADDDWFGKSSKKVQDREIEIERAWDGVDQTIQYMDAYQTLTYVLAATASVALFAAALVKRGRKWAREEKEWVASLIPACVFAVGFVVYMIWEAKSQYAEPFFMFLIPLAAYGAETIAMILDDNSFENK